MVWQPTQVLNIPLLRSSLLYPVPRQSHAAFSEDGAKRLDISCFMFPHRNPTYHYQGSSRAAKHLWARKNYKRSLLYSWNGITEKCIDQRMLDVPSFSNLPEEADLLNSKKGPSTFPKYFSSLPSLPFFALWRWVGRGEGRCPHAFVHMCWKSVFKCDWHVWQVLWSLASVVKDMHIFEKINFNFDEKILQCVWAHIQLKKKKTLLGKKVLWDAP